MKIYPLGIFTRDRRSWTFPNHAYGSISQSGTGSLTQIVALNNNTKNSRDLALWGILAFSSVPRTMLGAQLALGARIGGAGVITMLDPRAAIIDGSLGSTPNSATQPQVAPLLWESSPMQWLTHGDSPLFVIPPGYRVDVWQLGPYTNNPVNIVLGATLYWGYA